MRKKINVITITLFIIVSLAAIYFGWIDDARVAAGEARTWPIAFILVGVALIIGIIRAILLTHANKVSLENAAEVRSVSIDEATEVVDGNEIAPSDKVTLVHVDDVEQGKVIIRIFKKQVALVDVTGKVNQ